MRKLTIEILAERPEADWLWGSHMLRTAHNGVTVVGISEGHASAAPQPCDLCKSYKLDTGDNFCGACGRDLRAA